MPPFALGNVVYCNDEQTPQLPPQKATILTIPLSDDHPYTIQLVDGQDQWSFIPGRANITNNQNWPVPLPNFETASPSLIQHHILVENWLTNKTFMEKYNHTWTNKTLAHHIVLTVVSPSPDYLTNDNIAQHLNDNPAHAKATIFKILASNLDS